MPVKRKIPYSSGHFFITFTCYDWLPLIELTNSYDLIYNWFKLLTSNGHYITGYTIMPNHVHATIAFRECGKNINTIIGNGKRFIGYEIINRLQKQHQTDILKKLSQAVNTSDSKRGKQHEVWQDSFDWKECISIHFIEQKLHYMHMNACTGKYNLAPSPEEYLHSSAKYYNTGVQGVFAVTDYMQLEDIDLTRSS
jgi:REP element-mobilizing transposase RayT